MDLVLTGDLTGRELSNLVEVLNNAPRGHMRCPGNPTVVVLAKFHYADGPNVEVRMGVAGCWNATNGALGAIVRGIAIPGFAEPANLSPSGPSAIGPHITIKS